MGIIFNNYIYWNNNKDKKVNNIHVDDKHLQIHVYEGMMSIKKFSFSNKNNDDKLLNWENSVKLDSQQKLREQVRQMNNENNNRNK
ncbi:MAG TPA: hypothetical protein DC024_09895, partial [Clostridiales bacterium]|nr:hypothetical protein [Clostridiales bacterium]